MAVGTGFGFDLSQLDAELKRADEALKTLGKTGKTAARQLNEAFALAKNGNIQDFISVIDRLSDSLGKKGYNHAANMVREIATETTGAIDRVNRFATLMQTISDGGRSNVKNGAIESLKYQLDEALSRLGALNERLQFFTKGEGAKAVGANVVDTSALQQEANQLRVVVELLQRRLEHEQALAALRQRSGAIENQQALDTSWQKMEEERTKRLQQQSIDAKEANKAYEQAYNDRYQMYAAMYDKMWQEDLKYFERQNANARFSSQQYAKDYEDRQRYYERWINEQFLREQENNKKIAEEKLAEEKRINQQIFQDRIDQLGRESRERLRVEQMIRDTEKRNHEAREKELNDLFREQERQAKAKAKADSDTRKLRYKAYTTSYEGAIYTSNHANTLAKEIKAVKNLEAAREKLNKTDRDYAKKLNEINTRIKQHNKNIERATSGTKALNGALTAVGRGIASAFSVQALRGYVNKMIQVRGEMELQQRSLQAILQNKDAANEIWQKTIDLAVRSPFRIKDLVTYTKQLAAYRIEADKLYETNKMLADVSAGLGVDMQRLILAFGQVKAANFLRGTELRQFTEAGIPMLDELAKHFNDMNNTALTSADVFEMISKRMVLFEDVEAVFERMTRAGGTFYRMQEIQAETLRGQISNLKDSLDIMFNEMGKANDGALKVSVKAVKGLVDNYEILVPILKAVVSSLAVYKLNAFLAARQTGILASSLLNLGVATEKFFLTISKNPWTATVAIILAAVGAAYRYAKALKDIDKAYADMSKQQSEITSKFFKAKDVDERKKALKDLIEYAEKEYSIKVSLDLKDMPDNEVKKAMNDLRDKMLKANAFGATFQKELIWANQQSGTGQWWDVINPLIGQGMNKDIDQMGDSYENLNRILVNNLAPTIDFLSTEVKEFNSDQREALESLKAGIGTWKDEDEDMVDYFERIRGNYETLVGLLAKSDDIADKKIARQLKKYQRRYDEAEKEFGAFVKRIDDDVTNLSDEDKTVFLNAAIDDAKAEKNWSEFEETQIRKWLEKKYTIELTPKIVEDDEELKAWQESYNDLFEGKTGWRKIRTKGTSQTQVIEQLQAQYKATEEIIKRIQKAGESSVLTGGAYEGQDLAKLKKDLADIQAQLDWFGADTNKNKNKGKDEVLERLKSRINLIKEMNREYEKLNKTFESSDSLEKVRAAYMDTAKELNLDIADMDFSDEGTIKSLEALLGKPEYAANKYVIELQKALDNFKVELGVEIKQEKDKDLKAQVQELFDQYDLSLELNKLNISSNAAKSLFDFDVTSLDKLRKNLISMRGKFVGTDMEDEYKKYLEKIGDLEDKEQKERFKKYLEYAKSTISERAKIKMEELTKLKEIEETFRAKQDDSEDEVAYKRDMRSRATQRAKEESRNALRQLEWDEFQKTDTFTSLFDDIDNASDALITHMIDKIRDFKDEWKDMPLEDVRTMVNKLNELEVALAERSPWEAYRNAKKAVKEARENAKYSFESEEARNLYGKGKSDKDYIAALQIENAYQEQKVESVKEEMAIIEEMIGLKEGTLPYEVNVLNYSKQQMQYAAMTKQQLRDLLKDKKKEVDIANAIVLDNGQIIVQYKNQEKSLKKQAETLGEVQKMANDLYDAFVDLSEALGADEDSPVAIFADMGANMMNAVLNTIMLQAQLKAVEVGAYAAGTAINSAMGIIGWIVMAIQLVAAGIKAIAKINDNKIVAQLEEQAEIIERQRDLYEQLEEGVEKAYSASQLQAYNKELERSVDLEIQALEASIALEKSRKKADEEQIKAYEEEIRDARKRLAESTQEMMEEMGGIFDLTDFASGFVDAWWEAMEEGKSGLDALGEHFDETMKDMVKKQALYKGASKIMEQLQNAINAGLDKDYVIDQSEWDAIVDAANKANIDLDKFLEGYRALFGDLSLGAEGGLSGLTKGIQGITEDTAQIIEAYLNSIRGYMSEQVTYIKNISRIFERVSSRDGSSAIQVRMIS